MFANDHAHFDVAAECARAPSKRRDEMVRPMRTPNANEAISARERGHFDDVWQP
jgi:hypothetical protein